MQKRVLSATTVFRLPTAARRATMGLSLSIRTARAVVTTDFRQLLQFRVVSSDKFGDKPGHDG